MLVNERLTGDFFLVMKESFFSRERTYVPFRAGRIVEDRAEWLSEPKGGWQFATGENRERPSVIVTPDAITSNVRCPACGDVFSVCDSKVWNGARHCCGQSLVLVHGGEALPSDLRVHRERFDETTDVAPDVTTGRTECPRCNDYFLIRNRDAWNGERHCCGQRISLLRGGKVLPKDRELHEALWQPSFDLGRVEERSLPILSQIEAPKDGMRISGPCPSCGIEGRLRVCDKRIVLCLVCYFGVPRRLWMA